MPITETPAKLNEPNEPPGTGPDPAAAGQNDAPDEEPQPKARSTSRWVDYDTHELLDMISELEDERRWARLREGIWLAILIHVLLLSAITWIPRYVFKVPPVIDPFDAIKQRKDLSYLDLPPDLVRKYQHPKVEIKPVPEKQPQIDKKTLEAMNKPTAPPVPESAAPPKLEAPAQPQPAPIPPSPKSESPVEAPHPPAVPARPNFAMGSQSDQMRDAMRGAARNPGEDSGAQPTGGLSRHPGAAGGVQVLSDTQGVDFSAWLRRWYYDTEHTWDPLIPDEVNPPILKSGAVQIRFKVLPNGQVTDMVLEGRSGDTGLDRAAWGAITGSSYPPLPREFHGPYLELRALFLYNEQAPH
ncbi:MAG: energy transducer TonB [Terracidiphilus sp.]